MACLSYKLPYRKRSNVVSLIPMPSVLPWCADVKLARSHFQWRYPYPVMCKSETRLFSRTTWTPMIKFRRQPTQSLNARKDYDQARQVQTTYHDNLRGVSDAIYPFSLSTEPKPFNSWPFEIIKWPGLSVKPSGSWHPRILSANVVPKNGCNQFLWFMLLGRYN